MIFELTILALVSIMFIAKIGPVLVQDLKQQIFNLKEVYRYYKEE